MTDNDYIAEYVKEKRPEIIETFSFHFWKFGRVMKNAGDAIVRAFKKDKEGGDEDDQECGYRSDVCGEEGDTEENGGGNAGTEEEDEY